MTKEPFDWDTDPTPSPEQEYQALLKTLRWTKGFGLLFIQCAPAKGMELIAQVRQDLPQKRIQVLSLTEPIDNFYDQVEALPDRDAIDVLFVQGLEHSLYAYEQDRLWSDPQGITSYDAAAEKTRYETGVPRLISHLNLSRERLRDHFPICFIFLVPTFALKYLIRRAPDFFDWRSGVLEFIAEPKLVEQASQKILLEGDYQKYLTWTPQQRIQRILDIQSWLEEPNQTPEKQADLLLEQGNVLAANQDFASAIASYDRAVTIKPDNHAAWYNRGLALGNLGRLEEAIASFDRALTINPDDHAAWYNRGVVLGNLGRLEEAIASYDRAVTIKPDKDAAWYNRGIALDDLGRLEEAIASYDRAVTIKPDKDEAWTNRGIALQDLGRLEEAIASYDRAVTIKPDGSNAWYNKACCFALWEKVDEAIQFLQQAISLNSECREFAKTDAAFDGIRDDERFQQAIDYKNDKQPDLENTYGLQ